MFNRVQIKARGKAAFQANYWLCVLAALIIGFITSGGSLGASLGSNTVNLTHSFNNVYDDVYEDAFIDGNGRIMLDPDEFSEDFFDDFMEEGGLVIVGVVAAVVFVAVVIGILIGVFAFNPLAVGGCRFFLENSEQNAKIDAFSFAFKTNYWNVVKTMFRQNLYIFLWSLLLIVPGIIKTYAYRLVPYILAESPDMDASEALRRSEEMMQGRKWDAFVYDLSFLGWELLAGITCGILSIFFVAPYKFASDAELFKEIKYLHFGGPAPAMRTVNPYGASYGPAPQSPQNPYGQSYNEPQYQQYQQNSADPRNAYEVQYPYRAPQPIDPQNPQQFSPANQSPVPPQGDMKPFGPEQTNESRTDEPQDPLSTEEEE